MSSHCAALIALLLAIPAGSLATADVARAAAPKAAAKARASSEHLVLPFIEDDYPRALALARQRKLPIFIDSWAPW